MVRPVFLVAMLALGVGVGVAVGAGGGGAAGESPPRERHTATCARQSIASFPGAFTSRENLMVGPLSLIGGREFTDPAVVTEYGGNKFPAIVRAGHTVTVAVTGRSARTSSLFYAVGGGGALTETEVENGHRAITFRACGPRRAESDADGRPVTFWSGFVLASEPACVRLKVWIDDRETPRRAGVPLGRRC